MVGHYSKLPKYPYPLNLMVQHTRVQEDVGEVELVDHFCKLVRSSYNRHSMNEICRVDKVMLPSDILWLVWTSNVCLKGKALISCLSHPTPCHPLLSPLLPSSLHSFSLHLSFLSGAQCVVYWPSRLGQNDLGSKGAECIGRAVVANKSQCVTQIL